MLQPNLFQINEAWLVFKLNDEPIHTEADGDFDFIGLMDAASCFILSSALVPTSASEPSKLEAKRLLKQGKSHKNQLPKTLFIPAELQAKELGAEAARQSIAVVRIPEDQLLNFIAEAREGFKEQFGSAGSQ